MFTKTIKTWKELESVYLIDEFKAKIYLSIKFISRTLNILKATAHLTSQSFNHMLIIFPLTC